MVLISKLLITTQLDQRKLVTEEMGKNRSITRDVSLIIVTFVSCSVSGLVM